MLTLLRVLCVLVLTPLALLCFFGGLLVSGLNDAMQALWNRVEA